MTGEDWLQVFGFFAGTILFALLLLVAYAAIRADRGSEGT